MKAVAVALLLANLILFGWLYSHQQTHRPGIVTQTAGFPASVEPLVLLRERTKTAANAAATSTLAPEQGPVPVSPSVQVTSGLADVPDSSAEVVAENAAPPQIEDAPEGSDAVPGTMEPVVVPTPSETPAVVASERVCQTIGPFASRGQANEFGSELASLGREPAVRASQIEQPSGYWVYMPSMPHAEASRIIDDLSAKGVKDYFLGRQNFISLGVFSDKRSAEARVSDIVAHGYTPRLEPRFLTREVFWVDLEEQLPQRIDDQQWAALLKDQPDIRRQSVACE